MRKKYTHFYKLPRGKPRSLSTPPNFRSARDFVLFGRDCALIPAASNGVFPRRNKKQKRTLKSLFKVPVLSNIKWRDIISLLKSLGAEISEGKGSRTRIKLNGIRAVFHRPHPEKETDKGAVNSVKKFLENTGVKDDDI